MKVNARPFFMFTGKAAEAMKFYESTLPNSKIIDIKKFEAPETAHLVMFGQINIVGTDFIMNDSPAKHDFDFTPSASIFIQFDEEDQLKQCFELMSKEGEVMMPLNNYGFSTLFAWFNDRFGVSWQFNFG